MSRELPTYEELTREGDRDRRARAKRMKTVKDALGVVWVGYQRLKELGFDEACYCPKDGTPFEVIEFGSTGVFRCTYSGEWPTGLYLIEDGGDIYPTSRGGLLWRPIQASAASPAER